MTSPRSIPISTLGFTREGIESLSRTPCGVPYLEERSVHRIPRLVMVADGIDEDLLRKGYAELRALYPNITDVRVSKRIHKGVFDLLLDWLRLRDIPTGFAGEDVDCILEPFLHFEVGAHREDIWRWFVEQNPAFPLGQMFDGAFRHPSADFNLKDAAENISTMCSDLKRPIPSTLKAAHQLVVETLGQRPDWREDLTVWKEVIEAAMYGGYDSPQMRLRPPVDDTPLVLSDIPGFGDLAAPTPQPFICLDW